MSLAVSRAAKLLDEELAAWRDRHLGEIKYLILDARYEKLRHGGVVRDGEGDKKMVRGIIFPTHVLSAIGIGPDERRRILGVSVALSKALSKALSEALSEAQVHWRAFLESLVARGLRGVEFITSDDHSGLRCPTRCSRRCHVAALPIPPGPQRHPSRPQRRNPLAYRQTAEIDLGS